MPNRKAKKSTKTGRSLAGVKHTFRKKDFMTLMRSHGHFMGVLSLFVVISLFAIFSFWSSTNDYIDHMYASVTHNGSIVVDGVAVVEKEEEVVDLVEIFTDVDSKHINGPAIGELYSKGIIKGYTNGSFQPDSTINRAEFMVVVTNAVDSDFGGLTLGDCCTDVSDEWYSTFMCYGKQEGWIKGYEDGSCRPESDVTRAEAIKIAYEAMNFEVCENVDVIPFPDVELDDWFAPYACAAKSGGIIAKAGPFNGNMALTRAQVSQIVFNMLNVDEPVSE